MSGVRVVDLSRLVAGNILTLQLADFGAEVIKIEPPEGDTLRSWRVKGIETAWKVYSRNKKSVALDLRADAGRAIVRELAKTAQILVGWVDGQLRTLWPQQYQTTKPPI